MHTRYAHTCITHKIQKRQTNTNTKKYKKIHESRWQWWEGVSGKNVCASLATSLAWHPSQDGFVCLQIWEREREREERQTERSVVCVCMHESINVQTCLHSCVRMYAVCMQVCSLHMSACKYSVCIRAYECMQVYSMHVCIPCVHIRMRTYLYTCVRIYTHE